MSHCLWAPESKSDAHRITEALSDKINNYYGNKCPYFLAILFSEGLFCSKLYAHARAHTHTHTHTHIYTHTYIHTQITKISFMGGGNTTSVSPVPPSLPYPSVESIDKGKAHFPEERKPPFFWMPMHPISSK